MSLIKRNNDLLSTFFTDDFFPRNWLGQGMMDVFNTGTNIPAVNIHETENSFQVEMAAPGMEKKDFDIRLEGNRLTIRSEKKDRQEEKDGDRYSRREFSYQAFQRSFDLPKDVVDADRISAKYEDGLLKLSIPKMEEAKKKPPKMIKIS